MVSDESAEDTQGGRLELAGLFPKFFDAAPDAIVVVDASGEIVLANKQTEALFGYERSSLIGEKVEVLVPEGLRKRHVDHRDAYVENPATRPMGADLDLEAVRRDGTEFPVEISLSPLRTEQGVLVMAAVRDTTDRKRAEEKFEQLLEGAPDAMLVVDETGDIEVVNEQTEEMFGYEREELLGEKVEVLVPEAVRDEHVEHRDTYVEAPSTRPMGIGLDLHGVRKDGAEFPVEISLSPLRTENGLRVMAAVRDMTERDEIQQELRARAEQQSVVSAIGQKALRDTALDELVQTVVERTAETLRMDACKVLQLDTQGNSFVLHAGTGWDEAVLDQARTPATPTTQAGYTLEADEPILVEDYAREDRFERDDLLTEHGLESGISAVIPTGHGTWGVLAVHDREPRRFNEHDADFVQSMANTLGAAIDRDRSERELERYARRLERSNREWERFGHVVSHDLQEPIRMVNSYLQMLEARYGDELGEDAREFIGYAVEGGHRMRDLVRGLLTYSRVDTQAAEPEAIDIDEVVDDVLADLTVAIEERGAEIEYGDLPTVYGDRSQITQVFRNLLANAVKFVPGDRTPRVRVDAERTGSMWTFHVEDNGTGIEPEYQDKVFTIFQRLEHRDEIPGEGIGLALCRKIVERHGGRIWVDSDPDADEHGATFHFTLPAVDAERPAELEQVTATEPPDV